MTGERTTDYGLRNKDSGPRIGCGEGVGERRSCLQLNKKANSFPFFGASGGTFAIHAAQNSYKSEEAPPKCGCGTGPGASLSGGVALWVGGKCH